MVAWWWLLVVFFVSGWIGFFLAAALSIGSGEWR